MKRREFIAGLGNAAAWPVVARAQQRMTPVIGYLSPQSLDGDAGNLRAFRQGLKDTGYVEGENVTVDYRFADNQVDRLSAMATELVRRRVAVIVAASGPTTAVVARATTTIPIVFMVPEDPVRLGLVKSLAQPGGNMTGVNFFLAELAAKRLALLRELVPAAVRVAVLINPAEATIAETTLREVEPAASALGLQIQIRRAPAVRSIRPLQQSRASGLTRFSSAAAPSSVPGVSNWPTWRRAMQSPRHTRGVTMSRRAGL
jgi:putative ABC transport system substrate-binding protein